MQTTHRTSAIVAGILALIVLSTPAAAQVLYGSIVGNVADPSGGSIPGATVKVTQTDTNETREVLTNESGNYTLSTVPAGPYTVTITKAGFRTYTAQNVVVRLNTVVRVDAALQVGQLTESVQVTAEAAALQTDRADVHGEFVSKAFVDLPQPTRTYQGVVGLMPGFAPPSASSGGTNNPGKSMQLQANGTSRSGTTVRIDGVNATNPWVQFFSNYVPSNEAIETVNVVTTSADAEQGLVNGAAINVQTKSGTNSLHGSLYEYHVNSQFKARNFFLPASQRNPKLIENDLGGSLGGRIIRDKLFYFGSYEGDFISQAASNTVTVPTAAIRSGNMTGSSTSMYDPQTGNPNGSGRTPFPGNTIPASSISPISQKIVALIPQPNLPGLTSNYYVATPLKNRLHRLDTKIDWNAGSKLRVTGRYGFQPYNIEQATAFGEILAGPNQRFQHGNVIATAVSATYTATPAFVVDANWGLTRANQILQPPSTDKRVGAETFGIPGTNVGDLPLAGGMPQIVVNSYTTLGYNYPYLQYLQPVYQYTGNATWVKRSHNIRFGADFSQQHMDHKEIQPTQFNFTGGITSVVGGAASNQYNSYADFLLGLPYRYQNSRQTTPYVTLRTWQFSMYVRDQWQVNRKLTVSYGLRWEFYPVPKRADRGIEWFDPVTAKIMLCGVAGNPGDCNIQVSKRLFSPRIGIAYRPTERTVIRTGFSLNPEQINMYRDGMYSYPARYDFIATGTSSYLPVGSLATGVPVQPAVDLSSGLLSLPVGAAYEAQAAVLPKNFIRGYTESWNFTIQRDLGRAWIAQVGYVGTHTVHQHTRYNINYGQIGGGAASQPYVSKGITGALTMVLPYEAMHYNSLQATLAHRFQSGFTLQANYTRSKWIGLCCDDSGDGQPAIPIPQYYFLNRSLMGADRPDNLRINGVYELPFGKGKSMAATGVAAAVLGGWQVNGILSAYSGAPFTPSSSATSLNAPGSSQRADQVKANVEIYGSPDRFFDPLAYASVTTARFGTAGFNSLRGPGVFDVDLGVFRAFKIGERWSVQFRGEGLNITNTPHFANPGGNVSNMSLNSDGTVRALGGFTQITSTSAPSRLVDERFFRFGLRISF